VRVQRAARLVLVLLLVHQLLLLLLLLLLLVLQLALLWDTRGYPRRRYYCC